MYRFRVLEDKRQYRKCVRIARKLRLSTYLGDTNKEQEVVAKQIRAKQLRIRSTVVRET
jgi:hypothetical protein